MKYLNEETKVFKESGNYSKREYWEERNGIWNFIGDPALDRVVLVFWMKISDCYWFTVVVETGYQVPMKGLRKRKNLIGSESYRILNICWTWNQTVLFLCWVVAIQSYRRNYGIKAILLYQLITQIMFVRNKKWWRGWSIQDWPFLIFQLISF